MTKLLVLTLAGYLLGSIPTAILAGRRLKGIDIRKLGSGNAGATNAYRVLGPTIGLTVLAVDIAKGFIAAYFLVRLNIGEAPLNDAHLQLVAGCAAVIGHVLPIFAGFRGGKGVGTAAGVYLGLFPLSTLLCIAGFIVVVAVSRFVSLGSLIASAMLPLLLLFFRETHQYPVPLTHLTLAALTTMFIFYTHRRNIARLWSGQEPRFHLRPKPET